MNESRPDPDLLLAAVQTKENRSHGGTSRFSLVMLLASARRSLC